MTIEEMKERKRSLGYTYQDIAELSGVPLGTVQKIFGNVTKSPRRETILALEKVLLPQKHAFSYQEIMEADSAGGTVSEAVTPYTSAVSEKKQGEYTLEDYYALPDDHRAELIDGVLYDMTSPTTTHQTIALQISYQLLLQSEGHDDCAVFISPVDVQLDCDDRTMVEPDVVILCDLKKNINRCIYGAPDFVLEVLSPSTRSRDLIIKLNKYWHAGCREYWIVDPEDQSVTVYDFEHERMGLHYTFADTVPVAISGDQCSIDFRKIAQQLDRFASFQK